MSKRICRAGTLVLLFVGVSVALAAQGTAPAKGKPAAVQPVSIAKGKPIVASSVYAGSFAAEKAVDGNMATSWTSASADPQWIRVDLGAVYAVTGVALTWDAASAKAYRVEISSDDTNWSVLASRANMGTGARTDELKDLTAKGRYVRVYCTARTTRKGCSLLELAVFGSPARSGTTATTGPEAKPGAASGAQTPLQTATGAVARSASGFSLELGCGMPIPVGPAGAALNLGVAPTLGFSWRFTAGPGSVRIGVGSGMAWESTGDALPGGSPYDAYLVPLTVIAGYELTLGAWLQLYLEAGAGYGATFVRYDDPALPLIGVMKPLAGAEAGVGVDLGSVRVQAGARFLAVFYDPSVLLTVAPELRVQLLL
jgi:hypothetical protein